MLYNNIFLFKVIIYLAASLLHITSPVSSLMTGHEESAYLTTTAADLLATQSGPDDLLTADYVGPAELLTTDYGGPGDLLTTQSGPGDCFKGGDHHICLPEDYSKYDLPTFTESVLVSIEVHIKDIPKVFLFNLFHSY